MLRRIASVVFIGLGCLFVLALILAAVAIQFSTSAVGGTLATGRSVSTQSDGWYTNASYSNDTATIATGGHTIVVAPRQLIVDGAVFAPISKNVQTVSVTVSGDEVSFVADGQPVNQLVR